MKFIADEQRKDKSNEKKRKFAIKLMDIANKSETRSKKIQYCDTRNSHKYSLYVREIVLDNLTIGNMEGKIEEYEISTATPITGQRDRYLYKIITLEVWSMVTSYNIKEQTRRISIAPFKTYIQKIMFQMKEDCIHQEDIKVRFYNIHSVEKMITNREQLFIGNLFQES